MDESLSWCGKELGGKDRGIDKLFEVSLGVEGYDLYYECAWEIF